jgi:hypothetical protein
MKNIIPNNTRYVPFTQQNSCCVPTSISIVMYKLGIPLLPQELLGYHLGLILDKKHKDLFWNVRTGKRTKTGYGTQMQKKQYEINFVFKDLGIPLRVNSYPIDNFSSKNELITFISQGVKKDKNFIVLLGNDLLNNTKNKNGHACVIDQIYPNKDLIRLIDPSAVQPKWREFKIDKFIKAVKSHPTSNGRIMELIKYK